MLGNISSFTLFVICLLLSADVSGAVTARSRAKYSKRASILKQMKSEYSGDNICYGLENKWHKMYIELHQGILNGTLPPRYLVSVAARQGLADRIGTLPSHFLFALLTRRALVLATPSTVIPLSEIYDFPNLQLNLPKHMQEDDPEELMMRISYNGNNGFPSHVDKSKLVGMNMLLNQQLAERNRSQYDFISEQSLKIFGERNISNYPLLNSDASIFSFISNRGVSWKIFSNPNHQQQLEDLGFRRASMFHCIFDYLLSLRPNSCNEKCQDIKNTMLSIRQNQSNLIIGVQLRMGDVHAFGAQPGPDEDSNADKSLTSEQMIEKFVLCTNRLSAEVAHIKKQKPLIFVISDSREVRRQFIDHFGDRVLTDLTSPILHSSDVKVNPGTPEEEASTRASLITGMKGAASDMYLYSLAHFHIVSRNSGFGQKAAMLAPTNTNFHIFYGDEFSRQDGSESCTITKFVKPSILVNSFSGI